MPKARIKNQSQPSSPPRVEWQCPHCHGVKMSDKATVIECAVNFPLAKKESCYSCKSKGRV